MRTYRSLIVFVSLVFLATLSGCGAAMHSRPGTETTVILIRHAEKDAWSRLSEAGRARAQALVDTVGKMAIQEIYSPNLERNLDTVRPLARHLGVEITLTPRISLPMVGQICEEILTLHAGKRVLWVGNISGNLQAIYARLGGEGTGPIKYGQLYILTVPDSGATRVVKSRFGEP